MKKIVVVDGVGIGVVVVVVGIYTGGGFPSLIT